MSGLNRELPHYKAVKRLRDTVDPWLRKVIFQHRDARFASTSDKVLNRIVNSHDAGASPDHADAELELETRAWLREFWSRSIVAWLALFISIASLIIAICSFNSH
jgi:hypothetical protein